MHKGRIYPWLPDLWATESTWWPNWVPRKLVASFGQPQTDPQWSFVTIASQTSSEGVVSLERQSVSYDLAGEAGVWSGTIFVFSQRLPIPTATRFLLQITRPGVPIVSNRDSINLFTGPLTIAQWSSSDVIPPWYNGTPIDGGCRCALWSEV